MTSEETLKLISKPWCNVTDLMRLACVGRNKALQFKATIKKNLENQGYLVPNQVVPMKEVVKYLDIDIDYLKAQVKGD